MENIIVFMANHIFIEIGFVLFDFHRSPRLRQSKDITLATLKQVPVSPVQSFRRRSSSGGVSPLAQNPSSRTAPI